MKPEFMRLRRALSGALAALLLAVGIVALSPALSASAHHNTISVDVSCVDDQWKITWSITNSEYDKSETITHTSDESVIRKNTVIDKRATYTASEIVSAPVEKTLSVTAKWSNGVKQSNAKTLYKSDFYGPCEQPDTPKISIAGESCTNPSTKGGVISFNLSGVTKSYTVTLTGTTRSTTSTGGPGSFLNVPAGTYTITATTPYGPSATSGPVTLSDCAPAAPVIALTAEPCVAGGALGAVTATLSKLVDGSTYKLQLFEEDGTSLETLSLTATGATATQAFPGHGPGTYYATVTDPDGKLLATSASTTITACTGLTMTVLLEPCVPPLFDIAGGTRGAAPMAMLPLAPTTAEREISVQVDGLEAGTVYTVQLVSTDAAHTVISTTTTPGDTASSFSHTFTNVPSPGEYTVDVTGGTLPLSSDPISAPLCDLTTMAPPSIELLADQCNGVDPAAGALSARMIDLDATKTYYVRIVDGSGATVTGGDDQTVTGATTATVDFPGITAPGTYTAQLLIDPGKQLAATSPSSVGLDVCLPTLAMTGPGALVPLGSVAALLLTLGGAVVMGRLRRRMAL